MSCKFKHLVCFVLAVCLFFCDANESHAQGTVKAAVDTRKIMIGDPIKLWLEVQPSSPKDIVQWATIPDTFSGLEIIEKGLIDTIKGQDSFLLRQRLLVTGFDSGIYYIPSFTFKISTQGRVAELQTDSIGIDIQTIAVDTTQAFKPIKDIVEVPFSLLDYWMLILALVLLIGLILFVWIYFYKNKKTKIPEASAKVPPELAHEKALRLLYELKEKQLWEHGRIKEYYSELSDITRIYLEERFDIAAMEQTTDELLALLKKQNDARAELRKLRPELKLILRTADLAKFAKANPLPHEHSACMAAAIEVVQQTQKKKAEGDA